MTEPPRATGAEEPARAIRPARSPSAPRPARAAEGARSRGRV
ncbi:hypothetical protein ACIQRS_08340 [Streptomyces termitum]|nr:hypothetical protein [Streptomyces termitum]